jgi:hypothetical protein
MASTTNTGLEEHEGLGGGVESEALEAICELAELCDGGSAAGGDGGERVGGGLVHGVAVPHSSRRLRAGAYDAGCGWMRRASRCTQQVISAGNPRAGGISGALPNRAVRLSH